MNLGDRFELESLQIQNAFQTNAGEASLTISILDDDEVVFSQPLSPGASGDGSGDASVTLPAGTVGSTLLIQSATGGLSMREVLVYGRKAADTLTVTFPGSGQTGPLEELLVVTGNFSDEIRQSDAPNVSKLNIDTQGGYDTVDLLNLGRGKTRVVTGDDGDTVSVHSNLPGPDVLLQVSTAGGEDHVVLHGVAAKNHIHVDLGEEPDTIQISGGRISDADTTISVSGGGPDEADAGDTLFYDPSQRPIVGLYAGSSPATPGDKITLGGAGDEVGSVDYSRIEHVPGFATAAVSAGGPYVIGEGDSLTVPIESVEVAAATNTSIASVQWDLDGDGVFGDPVGDDGTVTWSDLESLGIADAGAYEIARRAIDNLGTAATDFTTLTVKEVAHGSN